MAVALLSVGMLAGENDLLWDFTEQAPNAKNSEGLQYLSKSTDAAGVNNGLKGVKLDSKGYCYFTKAPVAGRLKLYFGDRMTNKSTSLRIYTWKGDKPKADKLIAETGSLSEYGVQVIDLDETQNKIYITRGDNQVETVLQKIQFHEGFDDKPEICVVSYRDQYGNELGHKEVEEGTVVGSIPYTQSDLPKWGADSLFRGWYYLSGRKVKPSDKIMNNTSIQAGVTAIRKATEGSIQQYDLTSRVFYAEDEDLIDIDGEVVTLHLGDAKTVVSIMHQDGNERFMRLSNRKSIMFRDNDQSVACITVFNVPEFVTPGKDGNYYIPANDAASFLLALKEANKEGHTTIFLPNGVYDLGEITLTPIMSEGISIIGESMEGTIIKNAPDYRTESINRTATLLITREGFDTYFQDLTIQNALDFYKSSNGRAVCLWDQGTRTICKRVRLLSYQDTYYSDRTQAVKLFEDCEIHGAVDFICGDGCVYFKNTLLYCEKRNTKNTGVAYITANKSVESDYGYVFESCTIKSECPTVSFGRAWRNIPQVVFLNTLVDYSAGEFKMDDGKYTQRWTKQLMNKGAWPVFLEYNTHMKYDRILTPPENDVEFIDTHSGNKTRTISTVLTKMQAAKYTMDYVLGHWAKDARKKIEFNQKYKKQ